MNKSGFGAEEKASACIEHFAFCKSLKLDNIKEQLAKMLNHIGDNGMFAEYTMHDISHVDGMLGLLDKIIVDDTRYNMTEADWLMTVLAIYFHDLGMLITKDEYDNRHENAEYVTFEKEMRSSPAINEYLATLSISTGDDEHFLFQEYVRKNHGKRIWDLLSNCDKKDQEPYKLVREILDGLDNDFRKKLALVCKSHQDDELDPDLHVVDYAFGPSDDEKVNLLFVSVLLRVADVLHVTHDRTPDVEYRIISPKNKISIVEWAKQRSVKSIDVKQEKDANGNVDKSIPAHGFSVQASFEDEKGYFSFKKYLNYADQELKRCNRWCEESRRVNGNNYKFPWDYIDTERVNAIGFSKEKLSFEIDQKNILKLLTGHTLYNDSTVVLRELIQNAIDAGRLQDDTEKEGSNYVSKVVIQWDSKNRNLKISDNATGMNEEAIKNYLLKVGASKYSSENFIKDYPDFHSISRFGIGLLTCFMISDDVDVYTLDAKERICRMLKIRNLHGEYLMRHDADTKNILEGIHGTTFELKVREDVDMSNIETQIKQWIMLPFSQVTLIVDGADAIQIGCQSASEAVRLFAERMNNIIIDEKKYRVYNNTRNGIELACLQKYNEVNGIWSLFYYDENEYDPIAPIGTCIEGIRVTNDTPGMEARNFVAIANCTGKESPSTNVARNELEENAQLDKMYENIYHLYMNMYVEQLNELLTKQNSSWAINEINYQINLLSNPRRRNLFTRNDILKKVIKSLDCNIIDDGYTTKIVSLDNMPNTVCTIDSMAYDAAVRLVRDMESPEVTALGLLKQLDKNFSCQEKCLQVTAMASIVNEMFQDSYSVTSISVDQIHRRILFSWEKGSMLWKSYSVNIRYRSHMRFCIPLDMQHININCTGNYSTLISGKCIYLCFTNSLKDFLTRLISELRVKDDVMKIILSYVGMLILDEEEYKDSQFNNFFDSEENYLGDKLWEQGFSKDDLKTALKNPLAPSLNLRSSYHDIFDY